MCITYKILSVRWWCFGTSFHLILGLLVLRKFTVNGWPFPSGLVVVYVHACSYSSYSSSSSSHLQVIDLDEINSLDVQGHNNGRRVKEERQTRNNSSWTKLVTWVVGSWNENTETHAQRDIYNTREISSCLRIQRWMRLPLCNQRESDGAGTSCCSTPTWSNMNSSTQLQQSAHPLLPQDWTICLLPFAAVLCKSSLSLILLNPYPCSLAMEIQYAHLIHLLTHSLTQCSMVHLALIHSLS